MTFDLTGANLVSARLPHRVPGSRPFQAPMLTDESAFPALGGAV